MNRDELIEVMARSIDPWAFTGVGCNPSAQGVARRKAGDIFASIDQAGFVIVPREPTEDMIEAARTYLFAGQSETNIWAAYGGMIEASPLQEKVP